MTLYKICFVNTTVIRLSNFVRYLSKRVFKKYLKLWGEKLTHYPGQNCFAVSRGFWLTGCEEKAPVVLTHAVHFKVNRFKYRAMSTFELISVQLVYVTPISFKEGIFIS